MAKANATTKPEENAAESSEPLNVPSEPATPENDAPDQSQIPPELAEAVPTYTSPEERAHHRADNAKWRMNHLAEAFAMQILSNPSAERFLYGNPLDTARKCGEERTVGTFLAKRCASLADDFHEALEECCSARYEEVLQAELAKLEPEGKPAELEPETQA